jgi:hypothetical protein
MRKVLVVATAAALLCMGAIGAFAQIPNMQVYFDKNLQQTQRDCQGFLVNDTCQVVCNNFNMLMSTVEFGIQPPTVNAYFLEDILPAGALKLGDTSVNQGLVITYPLPRNCFQPFVADQIVITWLCDVCGQVGPPASIFAEPIVVIPNQTSGYLRAIEYDSLRIIDVVGMTSLLCPGEVKTEDSTWGRVKSLYAQ